MSMKCHDPGEDKDEEKIYFSDLPHHEWKWIKRFVGFAILVIIAWSVFVPSSKAHSFYSWECCNLQDCRPISGERDGIPWSEVRDMGDHYEWRSPKTKVTHKIPKSSDRVKPSQDGNYHGCELAYDRKFMCLYVPMMF